MALSEDALAIAASNLMLADVLLHSRGELPEKWRDATASTLFRFYCEELRTGRLVLGVDEVG
jgi:hypothetical protein